MKMSLQMKISAVSKLGNRKWCLGFGRSAPSFHTEVMLPFVWGGQLASEWRCHYGYRGMRRTSFNVRISQLVYNRSSRPGTVGLLHLSVSFSETFCLCSCAHRPAVCPALANFAANRDEGELWQLRVKLLSMASPSWGHVLFSSYSCVTERR